jgi:Domain of unknown function (DUF2760)
MTTERSPSQAWRWLGALLAGTALGAASGFALVQLSDRTSDTIAGAWQVTTVVTAVVVVAPLVAALITAALSGSRAAARETSTVAVEPSAALAPAPDRGEAALRLLAQLQQEGRLVDFLEEDLTPYSDAQIGSAVRTIHSGCRAVLKERLELAPILPGAEGATVTVEPGFDPAAVRVTGNVRGEPPYQGVLRHPGWRSAAFRMPEATGDRDHSILAPAEVEVL